MRRLAAARRWAICVAGAALFAIAVPASAAEPSEWRVARSAHFEIYTQTGDAQARAVILWLEQLRALVQLRTGLNIDQRPPVRILAFRDAAAYDPYRVHETSDAYYVGSETRDYIVMAGLGPEEWGVAAHEYAHALLREPGAALPLWLREGLAEVLATVHLSPRGNTIGGDRPLRVQTLQHERWMSLPELFSLTSARALGSRTSLFYAQSWAMADLVLLSPPYAPRFREFAATLASGASTQQALAQIYGKSLEDVADDLKQRSLRHRRTPTTLSGEVPAIIHVECGDVPELRARALIAEVVMLSGSLDQAAALYRDLQREAPDDPEIALGMGTLALRGGDAAAARQHWKRALEQGTADPQLCFRYASLAAMAGAPADDIRPALQRAIELKPDFDDARYSLALLEANAGHPQIAAAQLRAMRSVAPARAFSYWTALADALTQSGDRAGAKAAALEAIRCAANDAEHAHAASLLHVAETDFAVQMTRDAEGRPRLVTTRIPHEAPEFNPFIEPGDAVEHIEGTLQEVDCSGEVLRIVIATASGSIKLAIPGLDRVQIRNGPGEFTCGPQSGLRVAVEYAKGKKTADEVSGDVRGLTFR